MREKCPGERKGDCEKNSVPCNLICETFLKAGVSTIYKGKAEEEKIDGIGGITNRKDYERKVPCGNIASPSIPARRQNYQ